MLSTRPTASRAIFAGLLIQLSSAALPRAAAEELVIRSGPERVHLLELFSSEGCSSCPRAERWLGELRKDARLWQSIVPVAFHVDYWDGLGWKDRLAQPQWTARQRAYAAAWGSGSVYTPGFVVDGREWRGWFERDALPVKAHRTGMLEARANGSSVAIRFQPKEKFADGFAHAAWLGFDIVSEVGRGENSGRALRHDFAVLRHASAKLAPSDNATWTAQLNVHPVSEKAGALAIWIEANGAPLQAAGGWLSQNASAATQPADAKSRR